MIVYENLLCSVLVKEKDNPREKISTCAHNNINQKGKRRREQRDPRKARNTGSNQPIEASWNSGIKRLLPKLTGISIVPSINPPLRRFSRPFFRTSIYSHGIKTVICVPPPASPTSKERRNEWQRMESIYEQMECEWR